MATAPPPGDLVEDGPDALVYARVPAQLEREVSSPSQDISQQMAYMVEQGLFARSNSSAAAEMRQALIDVQADELNEDADAFVKLEYFQDARAILKTEKFLFIIGLPGSGKTSMAHGLMRYYKEKTKPMMAIIVRSTSELMNLLQFDNQILLFDDIFGEDSTGDNTFSEWAKYFPSIKSCQKENKFIFTSRTDVFNRLRKKALRHDMFKETYQIDLSKLNISDKKRLLKKHAEVAVRKSRLQHDHCLKGEMLESLAALTTPYGFPACVKHFIRVHDLVKDPEDFFRRPLVLLKEDLDRLWATRKPAFGTLLLAIHNDGRLDLDHLDEYSVERRSESVKKLLQTVGMADSGIWPDVLEASNQLQGTYLRQSSPEEDRVLEISHPAVSEAVLLVYGKEHPQHVPGFASLEFITNFISICTLTDTRDREKIILKEKDFIHLAKRFYSEMVTQKMPMVANHCAFSCKKFIEMFQEVCKQRGEQGLHHALVTKDKHGLSLLYWSTWNKKGALFRWVIRKLVQLKSCGSEENQQEAAELLKMTPFKVTAIACCINGNKEALEFLIFNSTGFKQRLTQDLGNCPGSLPGPSFDGSSCEVQLDDGEGGNDTPLHQYLLHLALKHNNPDVVSYLLEKFSANGNQ